MIDRHKLQKAIGKILRKGILRTESADTTEQKLMAEVEPLVWAVEHLSKTQQKIAHDAFVEGLDAAIKTLEQVKWNLTKK